MASAQAPPASVEAIAIRDVSNTMDMMSSPAAAPRVFDRRLRLRRALTFVGLLLIGILILVLRNADPVLFPIMYAEDARWTGHIITHGFFDAVFHGRQGFPVLGLVALQRLGLLINRLVWGRDVEHLPYIYAIISYGFMAGCAASPVFLLRRQMSLVVRLVAFATILLMPMGRENNEVIGRILNLGYLFPVFGTIVMLWALEEPDRLKRQIIFVATLFVSCLTMPVCFLILALYVPFYAYAGLTRLPAQDRGWQAWLRSRAVLPVLLALVGLLVAHALLPDDYLTFKGGVPYPAKRDALVEFVVARILFYPILAPFYTAASDAIACCLLLLAITLVGYMVYRVHAARISLLMPTAIALAALANAAATAVSRAGLSHFLGTYADSFPDRYYYGVNILLALALLVLLQAFATIRGLAWTRWIGVALAAYVCIGARDRIFEFSHPAVAWRAGGTFAESIAREACPATSVSKTDVAQPQVYFPAQPTFPHEQRPAWKVAPTWRLEVTPQIFERTTQAVPHAC